MDSKIIQIIAIAVILLGAITFAKKVFITLCKKLKSVRFRVDFSKESKLD